MAVTRISNWKKRMSNWFPEIAVNITAHPKLLQIVYFDILHVHKLQKQPKWLSHELVTGKRE